MSNPKVPAQFFQERAGVNAVAMAAGQMNLVWRETPVGDVGIDGQLEYVTASGQASGRIAAVQIKSGPSYFRHERPHGWKFYPEHKHRVYWERFPLPVILVLHDPSAAELFWVDARQYLREPSKAEHDFLFVQRSSIFNITAREALFQNAGDFSEPFVDDLEDLAAEMIRRRTLNAGLPVSFMQLFAMGLTNIARSLYFGMDMVCEIAEQNLYQSGSPFGIGLGQPEYEYLFAYVKFLSSQALVDINISDFMIDWHDRQLLPNFIAPLTRRGHGLKRVISDAEDRLLECGELVAQGRYRVAQESFVQLVFLPGGPIRVGRIRAFEQKFRASLPGIAEPVKP